MFNKYMGVTIKEIFNRDLDNDILNDLKKAIPRLDK